MSDESKSGHDEAMAEVQRVVAEAKELSRAADGKLTDHLANWIAGRYAIATRQLAADNGNGAVDWNLLRAMCHDLVDLRRGDHSAESLRMESERWEAEQIENEANFQRRVKEWVKENREEICHGLKTQKQKMDMLKTIFGVVVPDDGPQQEANDNATPESPAENQGQSS